MIQEIEHMNYLLAGKPKIFIGSSSRSSGLVKWLAEQIRTQEIAVPIEWNAGGFAPSKSTLQNLVEQCKICDFAVIFFTRDDDKENRGDGKSDLLTLFKGPRDNTIFEAGLFLGGLGLQPERCILVSSVKESSLPSDINGITYVEIKEPPPPEPPYNQLSSAWCLENLQKLIESVIYSVKTYGEFLYRPYLQLLNKRQLAEREQVGRNCLQKYDRVVVNSSEPEDCCEFVLAQSVAINIKSQVYYDFHFRIDEQNMKHVCSQLIDLLRILLATSCLDMNDSESYSEGDLKKDKDIKDFLLAQKDSELLREAINNLGKQLRFFIHRDRHPIPFRIAVHNVSSLDKAKCYLRHEDYFVEWFLKAEAQSAMEIFKQDELFRETHENRIFQETNTCKLYIREGKCDPEILSLSNIDKIIDKIIDNNSDSYKLFNKKDRDIILDIIRDKFEIAVKKNAASGVNEQLARHTLMEKIIDLFPEELWERIKNMCFGCNGVINSEWQNNIQEKNTTSTNNITNKMTVLDITEDNTLDWVMKQLDTNTPDVFPVYMTIAKRNHLINKAKLQKHIKEIYPESNKDNLDLYTTTLRTFVKNRIDAVVDKVKEDRMYTISSCIDTSIFEKAKQIIDNWNIFIVTKTGEINEPVIGFISKEG